MSLHTFPDGRRCYPRQWSDYSFSLQVDLEKGACIGPLYKHAACSLLGQREVPVLAWSHLAARYLCSQLAQEEVGPLRRHLFNTYLLYALVGSVIFVVDVATILRAQSKTRQLAPAALYFPQNEG